MAVGLFQPAQNPAPNPAGFAQAAAGIYDTMQQIGAAAQRQHQQQMQQMLKDQFETELKLREKGYTPYMQTTSQDPSGLKRRDAQQVDPSRVISDHYGRKWVAPAPAADPGATPQQQFQDETAIRSEGGRAVDAGGLVDQNMQIPRLAMDLNGAVTDTGRYGIHAPAPPEMTRTVPGTARQFFIPGEEEKAGLKARFEEQAAAAKPGTPTIDTEHFNTPVSIDHRTGKVTPLQLPDGVTHNNKQEKPDVQSIIPGLTGPNGGAVVFDKNTQTTKEIPLPKGSKRELTPVQEETQARLRERDADRREALANTYEERRDKLAGQAKDLRELAQSYQSLINVANGVAFTNPETKKQQMMTTAARTRVATLFMKNKAKADELEGQARNYDQRSRKARGETQPQQGSAGGQQPQTQNKVASTADIRAYAQQKGISVAAATREFQQSGYTIGGK